ncbi:MAG: Inner membrane transport permease YbhR [bacterium ADurb.Bin429]|nr:MAG: Inner membrane transport permease YbhR [bacterium ADurb.Bin429]
MNLHRILRLMKKELIQVRRDRRILAFLFIAPVVQLFLFGYAVSTDVNHVAMAVLDEDRTAASRALIQRFTASGYFDQVAYLSGQAEIDTLLDAGRAQMVLRVPRGFSHDLSRGRGTEIQTLLDGTDSRKARVIEGYTNGVVRLYGSEILRARMQVLRARLPRLPAVDARVRVWYNPELKSVNFMVPGVLCMVLFLITMLMTSLAIVREKEIGTLEQLVVTPLSAGELMLGKTLPFLLIGLIEFVLTLLTAIFIFRVDVAGSIPLLFVLSALFLLTTLGLGIFISTVSKTQHEATLTGFLFFMPFILLSGFIFPVENMPVGIQWATYLIPLRYFLEIVRGIFMRGVGLEVLWPQVLVLAVFGVGILALAAARFSKRLG